MHDPLTREEISRLAYLAKLELSRLEAAMDNADTDFDQTILAESYGDLKRLRQKLLNIHLEMGPRR